MPRISPPAEHARGDLNVGDLVERHPKARNGASSPSAARTRSFYPSCLDRRINGGAADLVDHVLPSVPLPQWALVMPSPLRFPLAFEEKLQRRLEIVTDTVRLKRPQLNPHCHTLFLDGVRERRRRRPQLQPGPGPMQYDVDAVVHRASKLSRKTRRHDTGGQPDGDQLIHRLNAMTLLFKNWTSLRSIASLSRSKIAFVKSR
jgi:hypothetical protein